MRGVLQDWLVHHCLNVMLEPLKLAAQCGVMLSDLIGRSHYCFTILASYIADTPEAMMLVCVGGKTSPVTIAMYKEFRDAFQHEPQTRSKTLEQLEIVRSRAHPDDLKGFFCEAQKFRLYGMDKPFWWDWLLAEPSHFFMPESLHHIHKEFWDHDVQWIILAVGGPEINFQFSVTQPTTGYQHFYSGISKLKQVTGRCHRDIQCSIIAVSADAAPLGVIIAVCALMHFRYLVQSLRIDDEDLSRITAALDEFHVNKHAIIDAGVRQGKGHKVIDNWQIPKLELMQSVVPSIHNSGIIAQWSANITEHVHITEVKNPASASNNNNYELQICRYLDCADKCNRFDLATSLLDRSEDLGVVWEDSAEEDEEIDKDVNDFSAELLSPSQRPGQPHPITNYFSITRILQEKELGSVPLPLRSFVIGHTTLNLAYHPSIKHTTVDEITVMFSLPDLRPALADFLHCEATHGNHIHSIGGPRRAAHDDKLPFDHVQVWFKICLQETDFYDPHGIRPAQTLNCAPPSGPWTLGRYDTVIIQTSSGGHSWPASGLSGTFFLFKITIFKLSYRMIPQGTPLPRLGSSFGLLGVRGHKWAWEDKFLTYVQRFNISNERDPTTQFHILKRAKHSNGTRMGDIIPVSQFRVPIHLVPHFGATADTCLMAYNSMEHVTEFWLNYFWDKHTFFALSE
jgi:hypothetical protein